MKSRVLINLALISIIITSSCSINSEPITTISFDSKNNEISDIKKEESVFNKNVTVETANYKGLVSTQVSSLIKGLNELKVENILSDTNINVDLDNSFNLRMNTNSNSFILLENSKNEIIMPLLFPKSPYLKSKSPEFSFLNSASSMVYLSTLLRIKNPEITAIALKMI